MFARECLRTCLFVRSSLGQNILRSWSRPSGSVWQKAFAYLLFDPAHFIMERKMMLGIKKRAEACMWWFNVYGCPGP